ncbi:MAG: phosphatase [Oscillospiraceae bacterium]
MILEADLHTHTIASTHAYSTISENCRWAAQYGLKAVAMTDHAMNMPDSPHVWHFENLKALPRSIDGVVVLKGIEANIINSAGELDVDDKLLSKLEWVVASMHKWTYPPESEEEHTKAYLSLCDNKYVDVIGHCTTDMFPFDMEKCVKKFKEYDKLVEINESSIMNKKGSRKNSYELLRLCKKYEVPVVIDSDSHFCQSVGQVQNALNIAEEVCFSQKLVMNASWEKLREFILKKRPDLDI